MPSLKVIFVLYNLIMLSLCSLSGTVPEGPAGPRMEGRHPQFPNLPALIDGRVIACIPLNNQFRELKKIPYVVPVYEPGTPSWSSRDYSSTPSILSIEEEVVYPWEIDVAIFRMADVQERRLARTKIIVRLKTPDQLMAEGYSEGNSHSASDSRRLNVEVGTTSTTTSARGEENSSSCSCSSVSTSKRGHAQKKSIQKVIVKVTVFPGAPEHSDPQDAPSTHFPNPRVLLILKRPTLEEKYLLFLRYKFIIPDGDATVNKPPSKCIVIFRAAFSHGLRFPLHTVIMAILNKYELAPAQVMPTS